MANERNFTADDHLFIGEDETLQFTITDASDVPVNVTGFAMEWTLRLKDATTTASLQKTTAAGGITITGTYNASAALNTQRVNVIIADTDTDLLAARSYRYALKRTDSGSESVLAFGSLVLRKSAAG